MRLPPGPLKGVRVPIECEAPFEHLAPHGHIRWSLDVDRERESVQQLWAKGAFLRVHRTQQDEVRGLARAETLALNGVHATSDGIEQRICEMIGQQVHFIDVEHATVG
ncbi:MAG: hypothetical protein ABMA15_31190, partial [Vicinamibacterales bacterium]